MKKYGSIVLYMLILSIPLSGLTQDSSSGNTMEEGVDAFNSGRYQEALTYFRQAEQAGLDSNSLHYNIAVTLYRLERFDEARGRFMLLPLTSRWQPLVNYNYGLIAQATGNRDEAIAYFNRAAQQQELEKISSAAERKLESLRASPRATSREESDQPSSTLGLITLAGGSDSNPSSLSNEFVERESVAEDTFSELLAYGQHYLSGAAGDGLRLYGLGFLRRFNEFDHLNSTVIGGGLAFEHPWRGFSLETGVRALQTRLDGDKVADQLRLEFGLERRFAAGTFGAQYYLSEFMAGDKYDQIDGNRHRLDLGWEKTFAPVTVSARYRYETNDRQNLLRDNGAFSSYSPSSHEWLGELEWRINEKLNTILGYEYVDARYDGVNRLRDSDGHVTEHRREKTSSLYSLELNYNLSANWRFRGMLERKDVDDVYDLYTYDKHRILGTVEYQF